MKKCNKCKEIKSLSEFFKDKTKKDGLHTICKLCSKKNNKKYIATHKEKVTKLNSEWRNKHKPYLKQYRNQLKKNYPWYNSYNNAKQRCENPNNPDYKYYGGRGIKFLLTKEECAKLWNRDKAYKLNQASIDRENSNGNYTFDNCRFIEQNRNIGRANEEHKIASVIQLLNGKQIKIWKSIKEASQFLKISPEAIGNCLKGRSKSSGGFQWKYLKKGVLK